MSKRELIKSIIFLATWIADFIMGIVLAFKSNNSDLIGLIFGLLVVCLSGIIIPTQVEELINVLDNKDNTLVE